MVLVVVDSSVLEHLVDVALRSDSHVLLAKMLDVCIHIGRCQLLSERDLLERHLVDARLCGAGQQ